MPRCSGIIGYILDVETQPGIWSPVPTEKPYVGEVVRDNRRIVDHSDINDSLSISNNISIVSNKFMLENMAFMKYITYMNSKWNITSVDVKPPRFIITLGGVYNG